MSLILKGIDLPEKGTNIVLTIYGRDGTYDAETYPSGVRVKAQAVQIPEGHGRLIDGDALYKFFEDALNKNPLDDWWEAGAVLDNIEIAPTILEAEEDDDNKCNVV